MDECNKEKNEYTLEQSRLLNARIRTKMNHKKIIGMHR